MFLRLLIFTLFLSVMNIFAQTPTIETGVSQTLAKWRAANYSDVRYKLNITLEKGAPLMKGDIEIRVNLTDEGAKNDLILDWRTAQLDNDKDKPFATVFTVNEETVMTNFTRFSAIVRDEHIIISGTALKKGENVIKIQFASPIKTSGAAITRYVDKEDGAEYVYSLFVPSDASTAFPVFDQPDLKARFQLKLIVDSMWETISNYPVNTVLRRRNDTSEISEKGTRIKIVSFKETKPISTYVFAFAAGDFVEFKGRSEKEILSEIKEEQRLRNELDDKGRFTVHGDEVRLRTPYIYVRKSQSEKFKQHAAEVFRLNREGVKFLEDWFDYKFPFPKYDLVLIPEFPFGGMEHAGATFLREDRVIFPTEPTKNDYITRANVIFHEAAHQWFGDTVTMRWFDDLWLKEGFAEFMAYKTLEKVMPEYNAWKIFYERNKQAAYLTDSTKGTTPIYQEIPNLSAAKSAYGNIVYRKAPSFLKQAEFYLGEKEFQTAVRAFLKKHEFKNAEWTDLVKEFELASKEDLKDWGESWVKQRGMTIFKSERHSDWFRIETPKKNDVHLVAITPKDILGEGGVWTVKTKFLLKYKDGTTEEKDLEFNRKDAKTFSGRSIEFKDNKDPLFIFPNYQDYGYGIFLLDERSRAYVLENIQTEKDDFLRTMMWGALWDSVREGELNPKDYVELVIKNINVETDESTIQTLLGRVSIAMNYYLSDKQREQIAEQLEDLLTVKMTTAKTQGQRLTFYRAFLNIASTEKSARVLKNLLELNQNATLKEIDETKKDLSEDDIKKGLFAIPILRTKDKFDIITKLLILGDKDAPNLLTNLEKTETSDEAKRYAYTAKAGIATAENKAKFWNDFTNNKEISESWIESAVAPFNSIRHSNSTLPYLEKALTELPNLKKNRKIFFVNGWLSAFMGGQKSEEALAIVNKFLADNPNLDKDLRLKILENSDNLERAVKIRRQFGG